MTVPAEARPNRETRSHGSLPRIAQLARLRSRVGAWVVDSLLLAAALAILGVPFKNLILAIGPWARVVAFALIVVYLTVEWSYIGNGQSVGKRALDIRVVGRDGCPVSPRRAAVRATLLTIPWLVAGIDPSSSTSATTRQLLQAASAVAFGLGTAIAFLLVFNRTTRQGVHDLIAGTYVVALISEDATGSPRTSGSRSRAELPAVVEIPPIPQRLVILAVAVAVVSATVAALVQHWRT